mgnify:CR=1 FL=1
MKNTVNNNAKQLARIITTESISIASHCIKGNINVSSQEAAGTVVEGNNICKIVMLKKLPVHTEYLIIIAEDIVQSICNTIVRIRNLSNPLFKQLIIKIRAFDAR